MEKVEALTAKYQDCLDGKCADCSPLKCGAESCGACCPEIADAEVEACYKRFEEYEDRILAFERRVRELEKVQARLAGYVYMYCQAQRPDQIISKARRECGLGEE